MSFYIKNLTILMGFSLLVACNNNQKAGEGQGNASSSPETTSSDSIDRSVLPIPLPPFRGKIEDISANSTPDYPVPAGAPKGAPNVLVIMTDDVGYGASSLFGGPIPTPNFERLAKRGLMYTNFHTTALCSPSRASLITGRNHQTDATGLIMEMATGYPGYNSLMPKSCGTIGQILNFNGWNTAWFGKNHNVPDFQSSQVGPFDLWPTKLGFEYFYGFIGADANQFRPALYDGTTPVDPYLEKKDYILDEDLADKAIHWIQQQKALDPSKPFFAYYAPGTSHAPQQAPKEWIAKFKGKFDEGYNVIRQKTFENQKRLGIFPADAKLPEWPKEIPTWDQQTPGFKKVLAREMEAYAGALSHCDYQIGRVLDAVEATGQADNTIIVYIMGDNGASEEDNSLHGTTNEVATLGNGVQESEQFMLSQLNNLGSVMSYNLYSPGWAQAMNSPFPWAKKIASHYGGTTNGMVISWPKMIKDTGTRRKQFAHIIDIVPTILKAAGIPGPKKIDGVEQTPMAGTPLNYSFPKDSADLASEHHIQYFEIIANRGIWHDGWYACTTPLRMPWVTIGPYSKDPLKDYKWELYDMTKDPTQSTNVADQNPDKLKEMQALFMDEARKFNVLPLDARYGERLTGSDYATRPSIVRGRTHFRYYEGISRVPEGSSPDVKNKSFTVTADVTINKAPVSGTIITLGGRFGGWGLIVQGGKPLFVHSMANQEQYRYFVKSTQALTPGHHVIRYEFKYDGGGVGKGGTGTIYIDDKVVGTGRVDRTTPSRFSLDETMDIGVDFGTPLLDNYDVPFRFSGKINFVDVDLATGDKTTPKPIDQ
jgi:arylsulfatase